MRTFTTVNDYDVSTKERVLTQKFHAIVDVYEPNDKELYKIVRKVWLEMAQIVDRYGNKVGELWCLPIDLGDGVSLHAGDFMNMVKSEFGDGPYTPERVAEYLNRLIDKDVELYKFLKKMDKICQK